MQYLNVASDRRNLYVVTADAEAKLHYQTVKNFEPEIFTNSSDENSEWRSLFGNEIISKHKKESISDWYSYRKQMDKMDNIMLYNVIDPEYQYIREHFRGKSEEAKFRFWFLDIETNLGPNNTFPDAMTGNAAITLIQIAESDTKRIYLFGCNEYSSKNPNVTYFHCENEKQMMSRFVEFIHLRTPAITTAWNGDSFDFPYIVNRMNTIGLDPRMLSPFNKLETHKASMFGQVVEIEKPLGLIWLDYIECYKKAIPGGRSSWSLEYISTLELGEEEGGKMDYSTSGFASMKDFILKNYDPEMDFNEDSELKKHPINSPEWNRAWWSLFCEYGEIDVILLDNMDEKINSLNSLISLAHSYGCNVYDTFATIKPWTIFIYHELYEQRKALPSKSKFSKYSIPGGYVFAIPGIYKWVISEDAASMYPNNMRRHNLSPETYIDRSIIKKMDEELYRLTACLFENQSCEDVFINMSDDDKKIISEKLHKYDIAMAVNGTFYRKDIPGIASSLVKRMFIERKQHKKLMQNADHEISLIEAELRKRGVK